jgi:Leucine-rich repeat (LRR) protein
MSREFQNIRILDIQKNRISSLEHRLFDALKNLNLLNASKNEIQTISEGIEACKSLEKLILDDNLLRDLPDAIGNLN